MSLCFTIKYGLSTVDTLAAKKVEFRFERSAWLSPNNRLP